MAPKKRQIPAITLVPHVTTTGQKYIQINVSRPPEFVPPPVPSLLLNSKSTCRKIPKPESICIIAMIIDPARRLIQQQKESNAFI